jgi:hypothetical protein
MINFVAKRSDDDLRRASSIGAIGAIDAHRDTRRTSSPRCTCACACDGCEHVASLQPA